MIRIIRRFQQPLMIAVTLLIIVAFTWLYNDTQLDQLGSGKLARIYGRDVTLAQTQRLGRKFELARNLGLSELFRSLAVRQEDAQENFIWNSLVLRHEAAALGIEPTAEEVVAAIQAMPVFQSNGVYDSSKYSEIAQQFLAPRGFTTDDMEDLIRDDLRLRKIKELLGATVAPSESELREAFAEASQKIEASVVRLKLDEYLATTEVTDEVAQKAYEARKGTLQTEETRRVKYVSFILPTTDKPLEGKERAAALGKLAQQAEEFAIAMTETDAKFEELAAKYDAKVEETKDFTRTQPPAELGGSSEAVVGTFRLTKDQPNSDPISSDRGYFVLQLATITEPRTLTFEEAKERLTGDLKRERANEALSLKATEVRNKIEAEIKAGKTFTEAAQAAGVTAEKYPAFSRMEPHMDAENSGEIMGVAGELAVGKLSPPVPTSNGSVIVYVESRQPIDEERFKAEKERVAANVVEFQKAVLFSEWLKQRRAAAQLQIHYQS